MRTFFSSMRGRGLGAAAVVVAFSTGCSHPATTEKEPAPSASAYDTARSDGWKDPASDSKEPNGWKNDRSGDASDKPRDDRQLPANAWFLNQPTALDTNTHQISDTVRPVVAPPVPTVRQTPPIRDRWRRRPTCFGE